MTSRGLRRKKSSLTDLKVAVVGAPNVGKSALIVRFLTKRYIGEYDHRTESRYKHEATIDGDAVLFEILDSCPKSNAEFINIPEILTWADGLLVVFSITDRKSFNYIRRVQSELSPEIPMHLVANKVDMIHLREVGFDEGETLATEMRCKFSEVSAADHVDQVVEVFNDLCREIYANKRKSKQSLLERMFNSARPYTRGKSDSNIMKE